MIETQAATLVGSVILPYVKQGGAKLAGAVAGKVGDEAGQYMADLAGRVWSSIRSRFTSDVDKFALQQFEDHPTTPRRCCNAS